MQSLLISVDQLDAFTPHTAELLDITHALIKKGWHVDAITATAGQKLMAEIAPLSETGRL